ASIDFADATVLHDEEVVGGVERDVSRVVEGSRRRGAVIAGDLARTVACDGVDDAAADLSHDARSAIRHVDSVGRINRHAGRVVETRVSRRSDVAADKPAVAAEAEHAGNDAAADLSNATTARVGNVYVGAEYSEL